MANTTGQKFGGRQKNVPNKFTSETRQLIQAFLNDNWDEVQTLYNDLKPYQKLQFIERMLKFVIPAPLNELERLSDEQLDELIKKLKSGQI